MMESEPIEESDNSLSNGSSPPHKRGRGRPRGSFKKRIVFVKELENNVRTTKKVDYFSPEQPIRQKHRKRGRPRKIRIPGRPRKIPLTPEEEAERMLQLGKKRKLSKPLGRPRIHPLVIKSQIKRGRGRPRKTESGVKASIQFQNSSGGDKPACLQKATDPSQDMPRKRGRPHGSFKKKRGRPLGFSPAVRLIDGVPIKRGRPPGSGVKPQRDANETPRKRGRPPGSGNKLKVLSGDETPRKRGRPPGSGNKVKVVKLDANIIPRKRGRPPGSGVKIHVTPQDTNGTPRKRGRPKGSGKTKTTTHEIENTDFSSSSSAVSFSAQPRKRGRPKKIHKQDASEYGNNPPSLKRARSSSASETEEDAEEQYSSENEADHTEDTFNDREDLHRSEKHAKQSSHKDVRESNSKKNVFSRLGGKSHKKK